MNLLLKGMDSELETSTRLLQCAPLLQQCTAVLQCASLLQQLCSVRHCYNNALLLLLALSHIPASLSRHTPHRSPLTPQCHDHEATNVGVPRTPRALGRRRADAGGCGPSSPRAAERWRWPRRRHGRLQPRSRRHAV
jgi:hypothetical protein